MARGAIADQARTIRIPVLETPIGEEEDSHLGDIILLKTLTPREERVIRMRFGIGDGSKHTLEEVGQTALRRGRGRRARESPAALGARFGRLAPPLPKRRLGSPGGPRMVSSHNITSKSMQYMERNSRAARTPVHRPDSKEPR